MTINFSLFGGLSLQLIIFIIFIQLEDKWTIATDWL